MRLLLDTIIHKKSKIYFERTSELGEAKGCQLTALQLSSFVISHM